jgi:hypothetical protein
MSRSKLKAASPEEVVTRIRASIPRQKRTTEIIGLGAVYVALIYLWMTASGTRHRYDKIVNFRLSLPFEKLSEMNSLLEHHARSSHLASHRISHAQVRTDFAPRCRSSTGDTSCDRRRRKLF